MTKVDVSQLYFTAIISSILSMLGIIGNIISIIIFKSKELKHKSTTVYLTSVCCLNIITSIYLPLEMVPSIMYINETNCKIFIALAIIIPQIKSWLIAFCSIDRLLFIIAPTKFMFKENFKFIIILIGSTVLIALASASPLIFYYTTENNPKNQTICKLPSEPSSAWMLVYSQQHFLFRTIAPFITIIVSSLIISWKIWRRKFESNNFEKDIPLTKSLVALGISLIVFRLPIIIYMFTSNKGENRFIFSFTYSLFFAISDLNVAFLIFLFLIVNKKYRKLFVKYFCCNSTKVLNQRQQV